MTDKPPGCWQHWGKVYVLERLVECANGKLTGDEVNNKLLDKDHKEQTAGHVAADEGNTDMLQKIWEWVEENLRAEEFKKSWLSHDG
jgi:hypothetical protein